MGAVIPSLLPTCSRYLEVGPKFIHGSSQEKLLEVSSDGLIECINENCSNTDHPNAKKRIVIENKCPYPNENVPHQPYNEMSSHHVPQCLSEMVAYNAEELWLVCYTLYAVSIICVQFDEHLWNKIMVIVEDVYGGEKVRSPSHLHPLIKELKKAIQTFCSTHCKLLIELPSFRGQIIAPSAPGLHSMYYSAPTLETSEINVNSILEKLLTAGVECKLLFHEIHKVLHRLAKEVLVFMISTKDRFQHGNIPNAMPLAYALKGNSISTKEV